MTKRKHLLFPALTLAIISVIAMPEAALASEMTAAELGQLLFFDVNLSKNRTQACSTCHDPANGFVDRRENAAGGAVSLGADGTSLGDRNAPTATYASVAPDFHQTAEGHYVGGQFLDGRAATLADQAAGPPLNPIEMGMKNEAAVVARLLENEDYVAAFKHLFGVGIFDDPARAYAAMTQAIAAFEQTDLFAPYDSKYDRYHKGEYKMTAQEELGMTLFFSNQFTNCSTCHQLKEFGGSAGETFTNYQYHNIGVPTNKAVRAANGVDPAHQDEGLFENPQVDDKAQRGKFKTPTLRNVAITGPYMHNGVFADLMTVIRFYNKYNAKAAAAQINPETGKPWGAPEVSENISLKELQQGDALDEKRMKALVAFLKTLTDERYEDLLESE